MSNLSFQQVMSRVRMTGVDHLRIRVEVGDPNGDAPRGRIVTITCDPQKSQDGDLAQKMLGGIYDAAEAFDRSR